MLDLLQWAVVELLKAPIYLVQALVSPGSWLGWADREALARFVFYGASTELFFVYLFTFLALIAVGLWRRNILWGSVRGMEGVANAIGRVAAWAGLIMVLQQIVIVFLQRYFGVSTIELGPLGYAFSRDLSWWSEELKLYNAIIVTLCVAYTFVQGGHVRVDLVYSAVSFRVRKVIDMVGAVIFMIPVGTVLWLFGWFYMWQALIVPNPNAAAPLERMLMQSRAMRWNVETTGFSSAGFDAYFIFKVLVVVFAGLILMQAMSCFLRALAEFIEGESGEARYLDRDQMGDDSTPADAAHVE